MKAFSYGFLTAATIVGALPAFAQTPTPAAPAAAAQATCEIEQGKPQAIARATLSLTRANAAMKGGDPSKDLKDVVSVLTAPNLKNENPVGSATDPANTIDLFAAADSAITVVENSSPACAAYMAPFRQQKAWLDVTNAAISALNANKLDSAEIYAKRSLTLDRKSPYPYTVLASVAKSRKNMPAVIEYSKQVVATSGTDTAYADVKERAQYEIASTMMDRVKAASAAEKKTLAREAINAWAPLALAQDNVEGTVAVRNLRELYIMAGDSAQIGKIYADMIADPSKYGEGALLQAGVV